MNILEKPHESILTLKENEQSLTVRENRKKIAKVRMCFAYCFSFNWCFFP